MKLHNVAVVVVVVNLIAVVVNLVVGVVVSFSIIECHLIITCP